MEAQLIDHFAVGSHWSGTGVYSKGVNNEDFTDNVWELRVTKREGENFSGEVTYWGTMSKKRITLPVTGTGPKFGAGKFSMGMPEKKKQFQNYSGETDAAGAIKAKFIGEGAGGQPGEGTVELLKQPLSRAM